jgi:hypothetical protein
MSRLSYLARLVRTASSDGPALTPPHPLLRRWELIQEPKTTGGTSASLAAIVETSQRASIASRTGVAARSLARNETRVSPPVVEVQTPAVRDRRIGSASPNARTISTIQSEEPPTLLPTPLPRAAEPGAQHRFTTSPRLASSRRSAPPNPPPDSPQHPSKLSGPPHDSDGTPTPTTAVRLPQDVSAPLRRPSHDVPAPPRALAAVQASPMPANAPAERAAESARRVLVPRPPVIPLTPHLQPEPRRDRSVRIGSIDIHIQAPPTPPQPARRVSPPQSAAPLARGFTSSVGLRQG